MNAGVGSARRCCYCAPVAALIVAFSDVEQRFVFSWVVTPVSSGDARDQITAALQRVSLYYERDASPNERGQQLDDFFEALTADCRPDSYGYEGDRELSLLLGAPPRDLVEAIGGRWERERHLPVPNEERVWYVAGEPRQVLVGVGPDDLVVGTPTLRWQTTPVLAIEKMIAQLPRELGPQLAEAVTRAQQIRRAQFSYCVTCRRLTAPEDGGEYCHGCMSRLSGVVF